MKSTFRTMFYLKKGSPSKEGKLQLMCRITIDGQSHSFSCKHLVSPVEWKCHRDMEAFEIMDQLRVSISRSYFDNLREKGYVTPILIKEDILGIAKKRDTFLSAFEAHNKMLGYGRSYSTVYRYNIVYKHLVGFIKKEFGTADLPIFEIDGKFISLFDQYLRRKCGCSQNTVWVYMTTLKHVILSFANNGIIKTNPFSGYKNHYCQVERKYLTECELLQLAEVRTDKTMDEIVRDLFLFSAFTGLSYIDVKNLSHKDIRKFYDGELWIISKRKKTNIPISIKLLEVPLRIYQKYADLNNGRIFPVPSNNCCNEHLREMCQMCKISGTVTFHTARHTFATMALNAGMPIESVSNLLGHTSIKTTQIYAKLSNLKVRNDLDAFATSCSKMERVITGVIDS